ncbi:MAG: PSD1 and planctomycete cytochrome C domain-containing protein [Bryobacteraceae bacterium]
MRSVQAQWVRAVVRVGSILAATGALCVPALPQTSGQVEFFEKRIRPVLAANCQACHNAKVKTAALDLSTAESFIHGGQSGALVSAGNPEESRLLKVISYDDRLKMPPTGKLKPEEIADLTAWVKMGAPWPGAALVAKSAPAPDSFKGFTEEQKNFWAFQPVSDPKPPKVANAAWVKSPVDQFILARLEEKGLQPAPPADKLVLLRRATFDLTGLPPTEQEIRDFLADNSPDAFAKVVDRLLTSPRYGERWGRHWLDVARYADSTGNDEDHRYPYAWRYRDYVIAAFNNDLPFDQFMREQIAGDLLPGKTPGEPNRRGIVATGFLALGAKALAQQDKKKMLYDVYDEQVDVTSKAFLGLTLSCARCHDHKFDPLLTKDYYSMISIFASTRSFREDDTHVSKLLFRPLVAKEEYERYQAHQDTVNRKKMEIEDLQDEEVAKYNARMSPRLADYMVAARKVYGDKAPLAGTAMAAGLDEKVLRKWAEYLEPKAGVIRIYLDEWHNAAPEQFASVAAGYQTRFQQSLEGWNVTLGKWRTRVRRMLKDMNMPPPEKPKFDAAKDGFFAGVYFGNGPFAIGAKEQEAIFAPETLAAIARLKQEMEGLKKSAPPEPDMACAVEEGKIVNQKVFIRGDYNSPGEDAPKDFPKILTGESDAVPQPKGSGRLELAEWLAQPDHPLSSRVMVNRIWQWHFGEGLVRTPDNFGKMGDRPTHPELLNYLARQFVKDGWSVKRMHRAMMLSSAYQMSSEAPEASIAADPENQLYSRFFRRRLSIEEIRDGMLALDSTLDLTMGGTLQTGFGTDRENSNDRLSLDPEKILRRTVYLPLRRANLPTLLNLFDFGDATTPGGKRGQTNVAPQALFMMNSEFLTERTNNLTRSLLGRELSDAQRLESAYLRILNRKPAGGEVDAGLTYIAGFTSKFRDQDREAAWQSFCRILMASNDFIYVD